MLELQNIKTGYKHKGTTKIVSRDINTSAKPGDFIAVLGPNGSGKSTLFKSILGNIPFINGTCLLNGKPLIAQSEIAKQIAVVYTDKSLYSDITVYEFIALGRSPHTNWWGSLSAKDVALVEEAISSTKLQNFVDKQVNRLSDGEKQRVFIARALAQDTPLIILDEPTAHLDLPGRIEIQLLLRKLCQEKKILVLMSTHDIDLSMQLASKVWLFNQKGDFTQGMAEDLVLNNTLEGVFGSPQLKFKTDTGLYELVMDTCIEVSLAGDSLSIYWTSRALRRNGYNVSATAAIRISCSEKSWGITSNGKVQNVSSLEALLGLLNSAY